jgi:hypothetical protein
MTFPNQQLFLERFVATNKVRYSDKPQFVNLLNSLTLDAITFSNPRKETLPSGEVKHLTDMAVPGAFNAFNQKFLPGNYPDHGVAMLVSPDPLSTDDLPKELTPGIYWQFTGVGEEKQGAVLVPKDGKNEPAIIALIKQNCLFDLQDADITVSGDLSSVTLDSATIVGSLLVVESLGIPANAVYDGTYTFDGTLTY